jgi:hypothetical protein
MPGSGCEKIQTLLCPERVLPNDCSPFFRWAHLQNASVNFPPAGFLPTGIQPVMAAPESRAM